MFPHIVCGADGCKAGWVVLAGDLDSGAVDPFLCRNARDLVRFEPKPRVIALDIPIGLPDRGARDCDREARKLLAPGRGSSVFPAPIRPVLAASSYGEACQIRYEIEEKRMSKQSWAIIGKIRDVDKELRKNPGCQDRIREIHPEICFYFMAGEKPMRYRKKSREGKEERRSLLEGLFGRVVNDVIETRVEYSAAEDDVLDAFAALWTAQRIASGTARRIPRVPPTDRFGLSMEMMA